MDQLRRRLYFENFPGEGSMFPNSGSSSNFTQFFQGVNNVGAAALGTVPVLGWVSNGTNACSFTETAYPNQVEPTGNAAFNSYNANVRRRLLRRRISEDAQARAAASIYGSNTIARITSTSEPAPSIIDPATPLPGSSGSALKTWANGTWSGGWVNSIANNPSYGNWRQRQGRGHVGSGQ